MKKLYKREVYKTREVWLEARGIGGSSASAIVGKNPWMSSLDLFKAIVSPKTKKTDESTELMKYGIQCEPLMRKMFVLDFKDKYKVHTPYKNEMYRRKDKPYLTATPDGLLVDLNTKAKGIWECKTHDIRNRQDAEFWKNQLPDNYLIQALHYLVVLNDYDFVVFTIKLRYFDYFNSEGKKLIKQEIIYHYIERSEVLKELEWLESKETYFWEYNVQKRIMPQVKVSF